jgi:hypothetical protein
MDLITGVDVSSYQDANTYPIAGMSFAIVKATESTTYLNPKYAAQLAHARTNGLVVGHYHFATGTNSAEQVAYFAAHADVRPGELIALDWEESSVTSAARDAWLSAAKAHYPHNRVILYCNVDYWLTRDVTHSDADGLWIADYSHPAGHPNITQAWKFHQYSSSGGIDHSVADFTSLAALVAWCLDIAPKPAPTPEDEDMSASNIGNRAGLAWSTGSRHAVGLNHDGPNTSAFRVVLHLHTGPWVQASAWVPKNGCDALQLAEAHKADCQGVSVFGPDGVTFDITAS